MKGFESDDDELDKKPDATVSSSINLSASAPDLDVCSKFVYYVPYMLHNHTCVHEDTYLDT